MDPENQSEGPQGSAGLTDADADTLFGGSEPQNNEGAQPQATPDQQQQQAAGDADVQSDLLDDNDDSSAADALAGDEDQSAADALGGEDDGEGSDDSNAPESYEDFEIPEGVTTFSEPVVAALGEVGRELGLSQEQAQKVIDKIGPAQIEAQASVVNNANDSWVKASRADKEVGGQHYAPSLKSARRAIDRFATPEFRKLLVGKNTRLANHPEMLRFLARVGKATSADRSIVNGKRTPAHAPKVNVSDPMATQDATADMMFGTVDT